MNIVVTSKLPASVLGSMTVAIRVLVILVFPFWRGESVVAASSNRGGGSLTGVMGRFTGVSNVNAGAVFNPPFETGFLLDSWFNAKACLTGVMAEVERGLLGVVACNVTLLDVGIFSESGTRGADSLLFLCGDGATGGSGGKNRGGTETRALVRGFLEVTGLGLKICGENGFSKTGGRRGGRLGALEVKPSGSKSRRRLDGG